MRIQSFAGKMWPSPRVFALMRARVAFLVLVAASTLAQAQLFGFGANVFDAKGLDADKVPAQSCIGFYKTPSFKCEPIKIPVYFARTSDGNRRSLVVVAPGAGGLDKRHSDYAKYLADNGINAVVMDPWRARGMTANQGDIVAARGKGVDGINYATDALAIISNLRQQPEWQGARFGFLGESLGGNGALNVARPFVEAMTRETNGLPAATSLNFDASVSLYPACTDRAEVERFKNTPILLMSGSDDTHATAAACERHVEWMNARGGNVTFKVLDGALHDWDAPYAERQENAENASACENVFANGKFTLLGTGQAYPGTADGFAALKRACFTRGFKAGNRGNAQMGYDSWLQFLKAQLSASSTAQDAK
jgi:dienelactone hydrolase